MHAQNIYIYIYIYILSLISILILYFEFQILIFVFSPIKFHYLLDSCVKSNKMINY